MITFTIPGTPRPWRPARVVRLKSGKIISHKEEPELQWKNAVAWEARRAGVKDHYAADSPVGIFVVVIYPRPRSWPKKSRLAREPKITRPDGDNILKAIKDALIGLAVADDAQFWRESIVRLYGEPNEGARVAVTLDYGPFTAATVAEDGFDQLALF